MPHASPTYDVIIIGSGITGASTAYHLYQKGITHIKIISPTTASTSYNTPGILSHSPLDNITRLVVAYGPEKAAKIWQFYHNSYQYTCQQLAAKNLRYAPRPRLRLAWNDHEAKELEAAVSHLNAFGFHATLHHNTDSTAAAFLQTLSGWHSYMDEGIGSHHIPPQELLDSLKPSGTQDLMTHTRIQHIAYDSHAITLTDENTHKWQAEMIVVATHHSIPTLLPELNEQLIPYADQWHSFQLNTASALHNAGFVSWNHGHEWTMVTEDQSLYIGGAKFLRPHAGIGEHRAHVSDKATAFLAHQLHQRFGLSDYTPQKTMPLIGMRCCDELPLIGPLPGRERVLVASGFMGLGLGLGLFAGHCLSELIAHGRCQDLPEELSPRRLRRLDQTD